MITFERLLELINKAQKEYNIKENCETYIDMYGAIVFSVFSEFGLIEVCIDINDETIFIR